MRTFLVAFAATLSLTAFLPAVAAAEEGDSLMCTLERKGLVHSPIGSYCHEEPWEE